MLTKQSSHLVSLSGIPGLYFDRRSLVDMAIPSLAKAGYGDEMLV